MKKACIKAATVGCGMRRSEINSWLLCIVLGEENKKRLYNGGYHHDRDAVATIKAWRAEMSAPCRKRYCDVHPGQLEVKKMKKAYIIAST